MSWTLPRLVIAALRGGGGKTTLSLGLATVWRKQGRKVVPFKKGPDYIDAAWLSLAADRPCHNLDTFLQDGNRSVFPFFETPWKARSPSSRETGGYTTALMPLGATVRRN